MCGKALFRELFLWLKRYKKLTRLLHYFPVMEHGRAMTNLGANFIYFLRILIIAGLAVLSLGQPTFAQESDYKQGGTPRSNAVVKIQSIAKKIEQQSFTLKHKGDVFGSADATGPSLDDLANMRIWLLESMDAMGANTDTDALERYASNAKFLGSERDIKIAEMIGAYLVYDGSFDALTYSASLDVYKTDADWFVKAYAWYFDSLTYVHIPDFNTALASAAKALEHLPENVDAETVELSIAVNGLISVIYFYLGSIELAAESTALYVDQSEQAGRPIDGLAILNNFTFILLKWGEYPAALTTAQTSYRMSANAGTGKRAKAGYRYAEALNALGRFETAETVSKASIAISNDDIWRLNLKAELAVALAGQGKRAEAKAALKYVRAANADKKFAGRYDENILQAEALIAVSENRPQAVFDLMQKNARHSNLRLLENASEDTQELMGTLANDKEVQRAREAELTTRNNLQRERIAAQDRQNVFMRIVIFLLTALGIGLIAWAMRRNAFAKSEAVLKKRARAGEKAKRDFLAVMSHELRTPLNGIIGLAEILSREGPNEDVKFKTGVIYKSGLTLLELLTNVLDMSKMDGGDMQVDRMPTALREITQNLKALWEPEAQKKGITLTVYVADDVPQLLDIDPMRTRQCLENLISNALKFTDEGRVHVHITFAPAKRSEKRGVLKIIVADTGQGMTQEKAQQIFEPFMQADVSIRRKFGGSGLGLAITRSIARLMDGDTTVITAPGRGSEFTLTLRAADLTQAQDSVNADAGSVALRPSIKQQFIKADAAFNPDNQPAAPEALPGPPPAALQTPRPAPQDNRLTALKGMRVLIAEDLQSNRDVLKIFLKPAGCIIATAENGQQALDALSAQQFDVILMDVHMPVMDGVQAMQAIRGMNGPCAAVPIIALTADASPESNARCMNAGADMFLTKPVVAAELFSAMAILKTTAGRQKLPAHHGDTNAVA